MRLWRLESVVETLNENDRIVEIQGLDTDGFQTVTEKMLVNYFGIEKDSTEFEEKFNEIMENTKDKTLRSFMKIPLLAVVCVQLWVKKKQVKDSMTSFYAAMVDLLIERASMSHETKGLEDRTLPPNLPKVLRENINIQSFLSILLKLGKIAYDGLQAEESSLVFQKKKLELEVGEEELQFALNVGLISQQEAPSITARNISVHFFHKSVQEFLAALYIVTKKEVVNSFCEYLSNLVLMKELSNVIMFTCGFCPELGCYLSENLVNLTDKDRKVLDYRKSHLGNYNGSIEQIYKMHVSWYKEIKHARSLTGYKGTFYVSDINVEPARIESIKAFLTDRHVSIKTLFLKGSGGKGITNEMLNDFLDNTQSLVSLYVDGEDTDRFVRGICIPSIERLQFCSVKTILNSSESPFLSSLPLLRKIVLREIDFGERNLGLSSDMIDLEEVALHNVKMSDKAWSLFVDSLLGIQHEYSVELIETNIEEVSKGKIFSSPEFKVTLDSEKYGWYELDFIRMWPV